MASFVLQAAQQSPSHMIITMFLIPFLLSGLYQAGGAYSLLVSFISSVAFTITLSPACKSPYISTLSSVWFPVLTSIFLMLRLSETNTYLRSVEVTTEDLGTMSAFLLPFE